MNSSRTAVMFVLFCAGSFYAQEKPISPGAPTTNPYVGNETCRRCHNRVWSTFYKNPHYKSVASGQERPEDAGCESCHGPGRDHVEHLGGANTIVVFSRIPKEQVIDA